MTVKLGSNIAALKAQRMLTEASARTSVSLERLSSGLRIQKASDDSAGLAISSSLNAEQRVLGQAVLNLNDGISVLNIASSAVSQLKTIQQRQLELASQAANGSYSSSQRQALTNESRALTDEYNRIVATTTFNGRSIFDSSQSDLRLQAGSGTEGSLSVELGSELAVATESGGAEEFSVTFSGNSSDIRGEYFTFSSTTTDYYAWFKVNDDPDPGLDLINNPELAGRTAIQVVDLGAIPEEGSNESATWYVSELSGAAVIEWYEMDPGNNPGSYDYIYFNQADPMLGGRGIGFTYDGFSSEEDWFNYVASEINSQGWNVTAAYSNTLYDPLVIGTLTLTNTQAGNATDYSGVVPDQHTDGSYSAGTYSDADTMATYFANIIVEDEELSIQVTGPTVTISNLLAGNVTDANSGTSGLSISVITQGVNPGSGFSLDYYDINTESAARNSIETINADMNRLSLEHGSLGAFESRVSAALNQISSTRLQLQAASSRITDADVAFESAAMIRNSIIQDAATSILANANQQPALALKLLN